MEGIKIVCITLFDINGEVVEIVEEVELVETRCKDCVMGEETKNDKDESSTDCWM